MALRIVDRLKPAKGLDPSETDDFRNEALSFLIPLLFFVGIVWMEIRGYVSSWKYLWPPYAVALLAILIARFRNKNPRLTGLFIAEGLTLILLGTIYSWKTPDLGFFLIPIAVFAGFMLDLPMLFLSALLASLGLVAVVLPFNDPAALLQVLTGPVVCIWLSLVILRICLQSYSSALKAARDGWFSVIRQYETSKDYQGELRQTLKNLETANLLIKRKNQELEEARFAAEQARMAKNIFAANVSHELLTPINLIAGYSETICKTPQAYGGKLLPPAYQADVWVIYHNAQHLRSLICDVLELSRLDTNKMSLNKEIIDANALLYQVVEFAGDLVRQKGLELKVNVPEAPVIIYADTKRIRQVWLNLIKNAIRFTEQGGITLTVSIQPNHAWMDCCVSDTGIGIQPENLGRLFQPFQQLDDSLNRSHDGAGLGLALSKYFVEEHGGNIWIESDPGTGTKVFFTLPLMAKQSREAGYGRN